MLFYCFGISFGFLPVQRQLQHQTQHRILRFFVEIVLPATVGNSIAFWEFGFKNMLPGTVGNSIEFRDSGNENPLPGTVGNSTEIRVFG